MKTPRLSVTFFMLLAGFSSLPPALAQSGDSTPVYIEDSPDADEQVKQAQHLLEQKRYTEAAAQFQKIAQEYSRKLMKWEEPVYFDVPRWVRMTIAQDAPLLEAYRKLFEPTAARGLDEAMKPMPDLARLTQVGETYYLCESGLEATLAAACLLLESARWAEAVKALDDLGDHPDLAAHQPRWHMLQAAAGLYSGDEDRLAAHRTALKDAAQTALVAKIDELKAGRQATAVDPVLSALRPLPSVTSPDPLGKPLYVREAQGEADETRTVITIDGVRRIQSDPEHFVLPTVVGETIYINTGQTLRAMDRSSLSDVWNQPYVPTMADGSTVDRFALTRGQSKGDQRGVLVQGDYAVAVMGRGSMVSRGPWVSTTPETVIACVNRGDGKLLWRRSAFDLDETLGAAFFHGTPVGEGGIVFALIRRTQNAGFRDAFVAAIDLKNGSLLWRRHISSCTLRYPLRGYEQLLLAGGRLFVADHLGAIACLDSRTGAMLWLHKMSDLKLSENGPSSMNEAPWQISPPVLIKAGLLTPPLEAKNTAILLDPRTGKKLQDIDVAAICGAAYLMEAGGDLLCIGSTIQLRDGKTLEVKWEHKLGESTPPTGRAAVTADRVLVPSDGKLITLNLVDGKKLSESQMDVSGNVMALDGQVLVTSGATVRSYMTWPVVYANLTSRIRREPTDARAGLALANAAIASSRNAEALEGVDHVVAVLRHRAITRPDGVRAEADDVHAELFQQLLRLVDSTLTPDAKLRGEIFERIAKATVTARDQTQYHLAFGGHLIEVDWPKEMRLERWREATRQFQTVLESPVLASQLVPRSGSWQQAGLEARMRLVVMIEKLGREVYQEYDDRAAEQFERLARGGEPDATAIIELARKYPLARSAPTMLLTAGEQLAKIGRHVDAITQLRRAYREKPAAAIQGRVIGQLAQSYVQLGKPRRAMQWLQRAERENVQPIREGKAIATRQWMAELGDNAVTGAGVLPVMSADLGKPVLIEGRLMTPAFQPRDQWPLDRIITSNHDMVQLRGGPSLDKVWEVNVEAGLEMLWINETAAVFWHEPTRRLLALDMRTGKRLWTDVKAEAVFKDMMGGLPGPRAQVAVDDNPFAPRRAGMRVIVRDGRVIDLGDGPAALADDGWMARNRGLFTLTVQGRPLLAESLFAERPIRLMISDSIICMADSTGRVVGIDIDNGQILWRFICPFDRLEHIAMGGESIALAGAIRPLAGEPAYVITTIDALTGDLLTQVEPPGPLMWVGLSDAGNLMYVSDSTDPRVRPRISVHQLPDGGLQWRGDLPLNRLSAIGQSGDAVIILGDRGDVVIADTLNRKVRGVAAGFALDRGEPVDLFTAGDMWHLLSPRQSIALAADFATRWHDGLDEASGERVTQLVSRDHVLIITLPTDASMIAQLRRRLEFQGLPNPRLENDLPVIFNLSFLNRRTGLIENEFHLPLSSGRLDPVRSMLLTHRVVFGVGAQTIVIPDRTLGN
ncbi:MAG: PQQ-binding-like beta-propeller repeat protein [Phycisphaeraceae bacterium]